METYVQNESKDSLLIGNQGAKVLKKRRANLTFDLGELIMPRIARAVLPSMPFHIIQRGQDNMQILFAEMTARVI